MVQDYKEAAQELRSQSAMLIALPEEVLTVASAADVIAVAQKVPVTMQLKVSMSAS